MNDYSTFEDSENVTEYQNVQTGSAPILVAQVENGSDTNTSETSGSSQQNGELVVAPDGAKIVKLPENTSIENIRIEGNDLLLVQADGSVIRVVGGALSLPTFVIGDVEIQQEVLVAALNANGINVEAGPEDGLSAIPQSQFNTEENSDTTTDSTQNQDSTQTSQYGILELLADVNDQGNLNQKSAEQSTEPTSVRGNTPPVFTGGNILGTLTETVDAINGQDRDPDAVNGAISFFDPDFTDTRSALVVGQSIQSTKLNNGTTLTETQKQALLDGFGLVSANGITEESTGVNGGKINWSYAVLNSSVDFLAEGDEVKMTFTVQINDGTLSKTQDVTITIIGTNDAPVITNTSEARAGNVFEAGDEAKRTLEAGTTNVRGQLSATDVDAGAKQTWSIETTPTETYGSLAIDAATGAWTYTLDNTATATQALTEGQSVKQSYSVRVTDDFGAYVDQAVTITITGTNDAPVIKDLSDSSIAKNAAGVLIDTFTVSDVDTAKGLTFRVLDSNNLEDQRFEVVAARGTISGTPGSYELRLKAGQSLGYESELEGNQSTIALKVEINDQSKANNLTVVPVIITVTEVAENVAPVITDVNATLAYTENQTATAIDTTITVTDDNANLTGATVAITGNFAAGEDVLGFASQNGITGSYNTTSGVLTLTGSATTAQYEAALESVTYTNTSDTPSTLARSISYSVTDGSLSSALVTASVNVKSVNDEPVITDVNAVLAYSVNQIATAIDSSITLTDLDNSHLTGATVAITANFAVGQDVLGFVSQNGITGSYNATNGVLTLTGSATTAQYESALESVTYANTSGSPSTLARTISYSVTDGSLSSALVTASVNVNETALNNAPVITGVDATIKYIEKQSPTAIDSTITVTDDNSNLTGATVAITGNFAAGQDVLGFASQNGISGSYNATNGVLTLTGSATTAQYEAALESVTYANTSNSPSGLPRTISYSVSDGSLSSALVTARVNVTPVNEAPEITDVNAVLDYTENQSATVIDSEITVTDVDNANLTGATVAFIAPYFADDVLGFVDQNGIRGSYSAKRGTLTLTGTATQAQYEAALESVTFLNRSDRLSPQQRTISYSVTDGSLTSRPDTTEVNVTTVNDAPVITDVNATLAYLENQTATAIDTTIMVGDVDNGYLTGATVAITGNFAAGQDVLGFASQNGITGSYNATSGVLSLTGTATTTEYEAALESITYANTSDSPSTLARTISYSVTDGALSSALVTASVNVTTVNDFPVITDVNAELAYSVNQIATAIDSTITLTDDSTNLTGATVAITGNFAAGQDVLGFASQNGITGTYNATSGVLSLTGSATIAQYEAALESVTYANTSGSPSTLARTISYYVTDDGTFWSAIVKASVNITATNNAPVVEGLFDSSIPENLAGVLIDEFTVSDVDTSTGLTFRVLDVNNEEDRRFEVVAAEGTESGNQGSYVLRLKADQSLDFEAENEDDKPTIALQIEINDHGQANNLTKVPVTVTVTDMVENVAPVTQHDQYGATEDTALVVNIENGVLNNDLDANSNSLTASLVSGPSNGTLLFNENGTFTYTPVDNWSGQDSFTYKSHDGTDFGNEATVTLDVAPVNDAPVVEGLFDSSIPENLAGVLIDEFTVSDVDTSTGLTFRVLDVNNEEDRRFEVVAAEGTESGNQGSYVLRLKADQSLDFEAENEDDKPTIALTIEINDDGQANNLTKVPVTVTVTDVVENVAPVTQHDQYGATEDTALVVNIGNGVLNNDLDANSNSLTAILVSGPSNGTLLFNENGTFTYIPVDNWSGQDSFKYKSHDGTDFGNEATVTLDVAPVNDAPVVEGLFDSSIPENLAGAFVNGFTVSDFDTSTGLTFRVLDSNDQEDQRFEVVAAEGTESGNQGSYVLRLKADQSLDFEAENEDYKPTIALTIEINDHGQANNLTKVPVIVTVTDVVENVAPTLQNGAITSQSGGMAILFDTSAILNSENATSLLTMLNQGNVTLTNIFTRKLDDTSIQWHAAVDYQGSTITVIQLDNGNIIGGYNPNEWNSGYNVTYQTVSSAFLFNLNTNTVYAKNSDDDNVTYNGLYDGPTFGGGPDLNINYELSSGRSNIGYTYGDRQLLADIEYEYAFSGTYEWEFLITGLETFTIGGGSVGSAVTTLDLATLGDDADADDTGATLAYSIVGSILKGEATIEGSTLRFDPKSDFVNLAEGATETVTIRIRATDSHDASAESDITVTIIGTNDAPEITFLSESTVAENATGALIDEFTVSDVDTATGLTFRVLDSRNQVDTRFEVVAAESTTSGTPGSYELRLKAGQSLDFEAENEDNQPTIALQIEINDHSQANNLTKVPVTVTVSNVYEDPTLQNGTMTSRLGGNLYDTSAILNDNNASSLLTMLNQGNVTLTNIFTRQSGDDALDWHAAVDNNGPTISVIQLDNGNIIGGYNPNAWNSSYNYTYQSDSSAFLFNLNKNTVYAKNSDDSVITFNYPYNGPTFGSGYDLYIGDELSSGGSYIGYSYGDRERGNTSEYFYEFTGTYEGYFQVTGLETFTIGEGSGGSGVTTLDLSTLGDDPDADDTGATLAYTIVGSLLKGEATIEGTILSFDPKSAFANLAEGATETVTIRIRATDSHGASAESDVTVTIIGTNDAPEITFLSESTVAENAAGVLIDGFTVSDVDTATGLTFRVLDSNNEEDQRFEVVAAESTTSGTPGAYELRLKPGQSLDFEAENKDNQPTIALTIEINDHGQANNLTKVPVTVTVSNVYEDPTLQNGTMTSRLGGNLYDTSAILNDNNASSLLTMLNQGNVTLTNIFTKQLDDTSYSWHAAVDYKGPTISIIELDNGNIIGGYNPTAWNSSFDYTYQLGSSAFLFNLNTNIFYQKNSFDGIVTFNYPNYGPTFGNGYDLFVDNGLSYGTSSIGYSYGDRERGSTSEYFYEFTGTYEGYFQIAGLETFTIGEGAGGSGVTTLDLSTLGDDPDADDTGATLAYSIVGSLLKGEATIEGTILSFDPKSAFANLAEGETENVTVRIRATDSHGAFTESDVTVTVIGTNDAPVPARLVESTDAIPSQYSGLELDSLSYVDLGSLMGTDGDDILAGGLGAQTLTGGTGADTFVFDAAALGDAVSGGIHDLIADYNFGEGDLVDLSVLLGEQSIDDTNAADYVKLEGSMLKVDIDGSAGSADFVDIAEFTVVPGLDALRVLVDDHTVPTVVTV